MESALTMNFKRSKTWGLGCQIMECCCLISEVGGREQGSCCLAFISARMSLPRSHRAVQTSSVSALGKTVFAPTAVFWERVVGEVSDCHFFSDGNIRLEWKKIA